MTDSAALTANGTPASTGISATWHSLTPTELRRRGSLKWTACREGEIGAFVAEMDFGFAPPVVEAVSGYADVGALGYLPPWIEARLGAACADFQQRHFGWQVDPGDIHSVSDVLKVLEIALTYYTRSGGAVILPTPAYMPFFEVPPMLGRPIIEVPMIETGGYYEMDLAGIDAAFRSGGEILILCNPHNPTGRIFGRDELEAVCAVVERYGGRVFADEIHAPLTYVGAPPHIPYSSINDAAAGHTLTGLSASKAFNLPGLKCAQMIVSNQRDGEIWRTLPAVLHRTAATIGAVANTAAYRDGDPWLGEVTAYLDGNRALLTELVAEKLPGVRMRPPDGTYLAWLDFRGLGLPGPPGAWVHKNAGILLNEGATFGEPGAGFARLNFATPRPILREIVDRLAGAVTAL